MGAHYSIIAVHSEKAENTPVFVRTLESVIDLHIFQKSLWEVGELLILGLCGGANLQLLKQNNEISELSSV